MGAQQDLNVNSLRWWTKEEMARLRDLTAGKEHMPTDWWTSLAEEHFPGRNPGAVKYKAWTMYNKEEQEAARLQHESSSEQSNQKVANGVPTQQRERRGGERGMDPRILEYLAREATVSDEDIESDGMEVDTNVASATNNVGQKRSRRSRQHGLRQYPQPSSRVASRYATVPAPAPPLATFNLRNGASNSQQSADAESEDLLQKLRQRLVAKDRSRAALAAELERARRANPLGQQDAVEKLVELEKDLRKACNDFKSTSESCMAKMNWENESVQRSVRAMEAQLDALAGFIRRFDNASRQ